MSITVLAALLAAFFALSVDPATAATCQERVDAMTHQLTHIKPRQTQRSVTVQVERARKELGEGDEKECVEAIEEAENQIEAAK